MTTDTDSENKISELRRLAESALVEKAGDASDISALSPEDVQKLVHELQVHQTELEMQNEELRQTQLALEASRDNFFELYDFTPVGYVTLNGKGIILEANLTAVQLLGVGRQSFIKKPFSRFASQEFGDAFHLYLQQVFETQSKQTCDIKLTRNDGTQFYAQLESVAVQDESGEFNRCRTIVSDITERKEAEEALRKSQAELHAIYEYAPVMMCVLDGQRQVLYVNRAFVDFVGKNESDLKEGRACGIFGCINALGDPRGCGYGPHCESCCLRLAIEDTYKTGLGHRDVEWRSTLIGNGPQREVVLLGSTALIQAGNRSSVLLCLEDVTGLKRVEEALRESEEQYRAVFDNADIGIDLLDRHGRIVKVNKALLNMLGYAEEELRQLTFLDITHPDDVHISKRNLEALMVGEVDSYRLEKRYVRKDGGIVWADLWSSAVRDVNGEHAGTVAVIEDITDLKKAEEERESLRNQLLQAQKMEAIGILTGGIAHDFNNLLTIMNGYTEMILMDKTEDDPLYADLQKILQTGLKGADMVQRLLYFTKQAATKPEHMDLNHRIDETKKIMDRTFPKTIEIETNSPDDLGMVNADTGQMDQLLMNLCINAKEAMPDGGRLRIETRNITVDEEYCRLHVGSKPGRYVVIEVADTGTGMIMETMDRIFDPFFTTKGWDFKKGTGLGLSVAKGIVEQHGGWMTCESEQGKGTTFAAYFPAIEESPVVREPDLAAETVPGTERILLVDDEEYIRDLGKRILERAGYTVITASNGGEALEIYAKEQANLALVILDLIMPKMEGKQCIEKLLKINPDVKVIVSTGHSLDARERLHLGALARGFVKKPYEARHMMHTVKKVLEAGRAAE